jgi:hypothetical protein
MTSEPQVDLSGSDGTTVSAVLAAYADDGFDSSFSVVPDEGLRCSACGEISRADEVPMSSLRRMEGESDPDDMVAIVAITCPFCAQGGTAVLGFGPAASAEDSDVLRELRDERDASASGNAPVGE